jgi:hypothetical protein
VDRAGGPGDDPAAGAEHRAAVADPAEDDMAPADGARGASTTTGAAPATDGADSTDQDDPTLPAPVAAWLDAVDRRVEAVEDVVGPAGADGTAGGGPDSTGRSPATADPDAAAAAAASEALDETARRLRAVAGRATELATRCETVADGPQAGDGER